MSPSQDVIIWLAESASETIENMIKKNDRRGIDLAEEAICSARVKILDQMEFNKKLLLQVDSILERIKKSK